MDVTNMAIGLGMGLVQLIIGLILAIASIYIGISMFGKFTKGINEWEEIKKGNTAVALVLAAIVLAIANVIQAGVVGLTGALVSVSVNAIIAGVIQLVVGIIFAVVAIYLAIYVLDKITKEIDEMEELKKGNVAVAIIIAGVLIAVSFVVQAGISGLAKAIGVGLV